MTTPADTARRFVTALEHGDADTLRTLIAPDVVARFPTASGLFPDRLDGAAVLLAHLDRAMSAFDTLSYEIHTLVADTRTAIAEFGGRGTIQGRDDYTNAYVMIFKTGPDGRIRELVEYYNPIATATYFGLAEVRPPGS